MKPTYLVPLVLSLIVGGCGSTVTNTDKPSGLYLGGATNVTGDFNIEVLDTPPTSEGVTIEGISCKNKLWESAPSYDKAVAVLKREVRNAGYNSVYIVSVENDSNALMKNCWSAIKATGIAATS